MTQLRNLSPRPELVVGPDGSRVGNVTAGNRVGIPGPFGRQRIVAALPLNKAGGPQLLAPPIALHDANGFHLADVNGNLIGSAGVTVHRYLTARWTQDTRALAS